MIKLKQILQENLITLYRGIGYNEGNNYYSPSKEFAMQFTRSGRESEIKTIKLDTNKIYKHNPLPRAYGREDENFDKAIEIAKKNNMTAILVDEGHNQPNSVFIINPKNSLKENPDNTSDAINLKRNKYVRFTDSDAYAFTYTIYDTLYVAPKNRMSHSQLKDEYNNFIPYSDQLYSGRIWIDKKIISFWKYPDKSIFNNIINELEIELNNMFPKKNITILNDSDYLIDAYYDGQDNKQIEKLVPIHKFLDTNYKNYEY